MVRSGDAGDGARTIASNASYFDFRVCTPVFAGGFILV